ncbi:DNA replication factor C, large subunit, partial [Saccharata proteae CBS 121410]
KREPSPLGEATTTDDFFGAKSKPSRSAPNKTAPKATSKPAESTPKTSPVKSKSTPAKKAADTKPTVSSRTSGRKTKPATYKEVKDEDEDFFDDDDDGDDIFTAEFSKKGKKDDAYAEAEDDEDGVVLPHRETRGKGRQQKLKEEDEEEDVDMKDVNPEDDFVVPDSDEEIVVDKPAKTTKPTAKAGRKRKSAETDEEEDETAKKKPAAKKSPVKKRAKKEDVPESKEMQDILKNIPTVLPPSPPPKDEDGKNKFKFGGAHANSGPAPQQGNKEVPDGAPNCLAGLTFVFTGLLQYLDREEGQRLVKKYGGKVTTAPSSKTSYVVLGSDAGPSKLAKIKQFGLKSINEDGLFALIKNLPANGGDSKAAEAYEKAQAAEAKKIKEMAAEMEKEERSKGGAGGAGRGAAAVASGKKTEQGPDNRLWTSKYAPTQLGQICGNKAQVEKLQRWLRGFQKTQSKGFKLAGPDGSGIFRAVMIHGPPGIGKTTAAHLVARLEGYDVVESNASDTRSKKLVEQGLKGVLSTTSLLGYFAGDGQKVEASKKKLVLIMDEVDGMSAGDRGGVGALAAVCKKTQIPMILICNDRRQPKMKPFDFVTYDLQFRRPTVDQIRSRIMTIGFREGLKLPKQVVDALIEGSNADIRQVVNMISTAKLDPDAMDFDKGKQMSKAWEKHIILKPWDILGKILQGGMFSSSSKHTLNDKTELYFNDHELSYLMLQENYLNTQPLRASSYQGRERNLKLLELVDNAAESISDGDLVDRMIHGSQQQWSLMPTHAVFSFVRPASFMAGTMAGTRSGFPQWLGKNSSQTKFTRMIKEIQGHMRLRSSGDRHEVRQQYVPMLWQQLVKKLEMEGKEAVPDVIELMDSYFLTKDDFDAIQELGVGPMDMEKLKIDSQAKATFTRLYNQQSHPLPFMKASSVLAPKAAKREKPDLEEALEDSDADEGAVVPEEGVDKQGDDDEDADLSKDKYVKQPKKKRAA